MRETVFLNNDREMPLLGLGVYKLADNAEAEAKRQARNAIRAQQNRIEAGAKRKVSDAVRSKGNMKINGKSKKASI